MPRKKPGELKSGGAAPAPKAAAPAPAPAPAAAPIAAPVIQQAPPVAQPAGEFHPADSNGDGHVSSAEEKMYLEFKRRELEDADAMRDAQRKMAWFSLAGMLLYPFAVVLAVLLNLDQAATVLGSMASVYFVSVAAIVAAFFGAQAVGKSSSSKKR
tara:strand:+ start:186 stop:653 length:468 start_codon:yes stop_codon:yes gene_type:complete